MHAIYPRQFGNPNAPPPTEEYLAETNLPQIMGLVGTFSGLALMVVAARMYVRAKMLRFVGLDDWIMLSAAAMSLAVLICFGGESQLGIGRHIETWKLWQFNAYLKWSFAHGLVVMWGLSLVKISIAFFLMRIVPKKAWKMFLWGSIIFLACFALACTGTLIFNCTPVRAAWTPSLRGDPNTKCFSTKTYGKIGLFNSIVNIITDVLFAVLPIPIIIKLQVNLRTKLSLTFVLSLGFVACAAGIVKARLQVTVLETFDSFFEDSFMVWYMLELNLGIMAASLPSLKPLFAAALDGTRSRLGMSNPSRTHPSGRSPGMYPGLSNASAGFKRHHDPRPFERDEVEELDLQDFRKSGARTMIRSISKRGEPEGLHAKMPYDVRVTSGSVDEREEWGDAPGLGRTESEERLHQPQGGIMRRVEMTTTREDAR